MATTVEMIAEAVLAETQAGTQAEIGTEVATGAVTEDVKGRATETGGIPSHSIQAIYPVHYLESWSASCVCSDL